MDYKPLPIGVDDFEKLITSGYYFVDKTMFIKELLDKKGDVNLFTRPRRFGKSLNMSMLRYFFEDGRSRDGEQTGYAHLFENLKITECGPEYLQHMGKYPVIQLSLKSAKQAGFQSAYTMLARGIAEEFDRHQYILSDSRLVSICSIVRSSPLLTTVMRDTVVSSVSPTARDSILKHLLENRPATLHKTPDLFSTSTEYIFFTLPSILDKIHGINQTF